MKRQHRSAPEPSHASAIAALGVLVILEGAWIAFVIWLGVRAHEHWLVVVAMIVGFGGIIAGGFVILHGLYLMYALLPAIDEHLDPHLAAYTRQRGDPMFWRVHRVLLYGMSAASTWAHRRMEYREYDFRGLPLGLRLPLILECYTLYGGFAAMIFGAALMELSATFGHL